VDVVPDLGLNLPGAVGKRKRNVEVAGLLRLDLLGGDDESGGDGLVLVLRAIAYEKVLHNGPILRGERLIVAGTLARKQGAEHLKSLSTRMTRMTRIFTDFLDLVLTEMKQSWTMKDWSIGNLKSEVDP
jgi:hypothetical protein